MYGGLHVETPSRVLKRALLLERAGAELDNLPGLPDSSTDDDASDFYREPDSSLVQTPGPPTRTRHGSRPPENDDESTARTARVAHQHVAQRPRMAELTASDEDEEGGGSMIIHDETEETDQSELDDIELVRSGSAPSSVDSPDALAHVQTRRPASRMRRSQHADGRLPSLTSASSTSSPSSAGISSPAFAQLDAFPTPPGKEARAPDVSIVAAESEHEGSLIDAHVRAEVSPDYQPSPLRQQAAMPSPPDTPLSVDYSNRPPPSNYATPRPLPADGDADAERRKTHLLSALRVTAVRSAARAKMKAGTPHPRGGRTLHALSPGPAAVRAVSEEDEDEPAASASDGTSNDLTTHGRANASQPIGETVGQDRFNGVKLNAYMSGLNARLTKENEALGAKVDDLDAENRQLRRRIGQLDGGQAASDTETGDPGEVERLNELLHQRDVRVAELEERLQHAVSARPLSRSSPRVVDSLQAEITELKERLAVADPELAAEWQERADELLIELEARDAELAELRDAGLRAEDDFSDRLAKMERASCSAIEEVERQLADSRVQLEQLERERQAMQAELDEARGEVSRLAHEDDQDVLALREERDRLRADLDEIERSDDERVVELERALAERDEGLKAAEEREAALLDETDALRKAVEDERRRVSSRDQTVAALRLDATNAANDMASLRTQITAAATARPAERPSSLVADLEAQLHAARREVARLRAQPSVHASDAGAKDLEIEALRAAKDELEHRVASLRRQQTAVKPIIPSGSYTSPDASVARPPLPSIHTPKTPGQMARDWVRCPRLSPTDVADHDAGIAVGQRDDQPAAGADPRA